MLALCLRCAMRSDWLKKRSYFTSNSNFGLSVCEEALRPFLRQSDTVTKSVLGKYLQEVAIEFRSASCIIKRWACWMDWVDCVDSALVGFVDTTKVLSGAPAEEICFKEIDWYGWIKPFTAAVSDPWCRISFTCAVITAALWHWIACFRRLLLVP